MGTAQSRASTGGTFRPVGYQQPGRRVRTDEEIDLANLTDQEREVVEADDFVVFGKANIEQWNDPAPGEHNLYIEMDALEEKIDQLLAIDNISFGHQDVRVGEPLESYTLETDAVVHLDNDQTLNFSAGDELRTQVVREGETLPDGSGPAEEDALWLAANVFGRNDPRGSRFSQKVRLGAYYGDLDGFSVTIDKLEMTPTEQGVRTHEVDFLAVTIGDDQMIKNPGSSFGVAEFQAIFGEVPPTLSRTGDAVSPESGQAEAVAQESTMRNIIMGSLFDRLRRSSTDALASEAIQQAYESSTDLSDAVEQLTDGDGDEVLQQAEEKLEQLETEVETIATEQDDADAVEDAAADLADALGMDKEYIMEMVKEYQRMEEDMDDEQEETHDAPPDDDDDEEDEEMEQMSEERVAEIVEEQLSARLPDGEVATAEEVQSAVEEATEGLATSETLEEQLSELGSSLSEDIGEFVETQMQTGGTPGPTGGGVNVKDVESEMEEWANQITPEAGGE